MVENKKVKLSEGEALKNKGAKASDNKIQIWIPKSTIAYEEEKLKLAKEKKEAEEAAELKKK